MQDYQFLLLNLGSDSNFDYKANKQKWKLRSTFKKNPTTLLEIFVLVKMGIYFAVTSLK